MTWLGADLHKSSHTLAAVASGAGELLGDRTIRVGEPGFSQPRGSTLAVGRGQCRGASARADPGGRRRPHRRLPLRAPRRPRGRRRSRRRDHRDRRRSDTRAAPRTSSGRRQVRRGAARASRLARYTKRLPDDRRCFAAGGSARAHGWQRFSPIAVADLPRRRRDNLPGGQTGSTDRVREAATGHPRPVRPVKRAPAVR